MMVREPNAAEPGATKAMASAVEDRTGAKPAAVEYGAAGSQAPAMKHRAASAVKHRAASMKAASTMETTSPVETTSAVEAASAVKATATATTVEATTAAASAMPATADFSCQSVGGKLCRRRSARIDQRQRLRALWNG